MCYRKGACRWAERTGTACPGSVDPAKNTRMLLDWSIALLLPDFLGQCHTCCLHKPRIPPEAIHGPERYTVGASTLRSSLTARSGILFL